jgi:hypothetical protein
MLRRRSISIVNSPEDNYNMVLSELKAKATHIPLDDKLNELLALITKHENELKEKTEQIIILKQIIINLICLLLVVYIN